MLLLMKELLLTLAESLLDVEFESATLHSSYEDGSVTVRDMGTMKFAIGNCLATSETVIAEFAHLGSVDLVLAHYEKPFKADVASLFMPFHCAVSVHDESSGVDYVVDFTARQFDKKEAFPKVTTLDEWKSDIDAHALRLFNQTDSVLDFEDFGESLLSA